MGARGTSNTNVRGNSVDRHKRKLWLLATFGDGHEAPCAHCGTALTYHSITADRIIPGCDGGRYVRGNIRPSCSPCASTQGGALGSARKALALES